MLASRDERPQTKKVFNIYLLLIPFVFLFILFFGWYE